ncbi:hypothetical protein E4U50_007988 [Claviceps purpurea]|nr:hypothetical protein E4U50_007988 [Claviceps purpurea]
MPERILGTWRSQERRPRRVKRSISTEPAGSWNPPAWIKKGNCKSSAAVSKTEALMSSGRARLAWLRDQGLLKPLRSLGLSRDNRNYSSGFRSWTHFASPCSAPVWPLGSLGSPKMDLF